jgi:hypothetical protein
VHPLNHSIAEIVCHITAWHFFVIEKLKGNASYEVWETELDWRHINGLSDLEWQSLQDDLHRSQELLLQQIAKMDEVKLTSTVDGRKYNFRFMLQGIAQHTVYHLGQISIIKKLVSKS